MFQIYDFIKNIKVGNIEVFLEPFRRFINQIINYIDNSVDFSWTASTDLDNNAKNNYINPKKLLMLLEVPIIF
jgi:hypothetical protein